MILIICGNGRIGLATSAILASQNIPTTVLTKNPRKASALLPDNIRIVEGNLYTIEWIRRALKGVTKVLLITPSDPDQVQWESNIVEQSSDLGVQHIVKISTLGADPQSPSTIARWHGESEANLKTAGLSYTLLRCHNFMQNTISLAPSIALENKFYAPLGDAKIAMVDVKDIAEVAAKVLTEDGHDGNIYRMTGGEAISYHDVAEVISDITGKTTTYINIDPEQERKRMRRLNRSGWEIEDLLLLYQQFREGGGARIWDDIPRLLGRPQRTFRQFVEDYLPTFRGDRYRS